MTKDGQHLSNVSLGNPVQNAPQNAAEHTREEDPSQALWVWSTALDGRDLESDQ